MRHLTLITTGGTIEKTYDERSGELSNRRSIVGRMLRRLRLADAEVRTIELMSKDSLEMTDGDRDRIVDAVRLAGADPDGTPGGAGGAWSSDGVVILHGTDTLALTGRRLLAELPRVRVPVVLTGAMRPFEMIRSDALQNLTEALFATSVLPPGVWCVAHGRALAFPDVAKDVALGTFVDAATERASIDSDKAPEGGTP